MRQINDEGLRQLELWEGEAGGKPALRAYRDGGGVWTIGFGHTKGVVAGMTCTPERARTWLAQDLDEAETAVNRYVKVPLNDNQFAALVMFAFNVGVAAFKGSTLLRVLNQGRYDLVPAQLQRWVKDRNPATGKLETVRGLVNRRNAEIKLWHTPDPKAAPLTPVPLAVVEPEQTGRRPVPPPAPETVLNTSTGRAQTTALVAGSAAAATELVQENFGDSLREMLGQLEPLAYMADFIQPLLVGGTLLLIAWTLWDRRRKLREQGH